MASVYAYDDGTLSFAKKDEGLKAEYNPNDEITVYTSKDYQDITMPSGDQVVMNPNFSIQSVKIRAYEAAAHNLYDDRFGIYATKESVERLLDKAKGLYLNNSVETSQPAAAVPEGVVFMDDAVGDHKDAALMQPDLTENQASEPVNSGVIFMDNVVGDKVSDNVLDSVQNTISESAINTAETSATKSQDETQTAFVPDEPVQKQTEDRLSKQPVFPEDAVVLSHVSASQVFKTKRDDVKVVRVMCNDVPSGSFSFAVNNDYIKANRDGDKVISYDINIGFPDYYKDVSYKDTDGKYKHMSFDVLDILSKFEAQNQGFDHTNAVRDAKPLYLNYMDRGNVKESKTEGRMNVYVPYKGSEDGFLRIQVKKDQVLLSKREGTIVPGKFNIRLDGDGVYQAFITKNGKIEEVADGISAKDILTNYLDYQHQMRDGSVAKPAFQAETQAQSDLPQQPSENMVLRSEFVDAENDNIPMFSNFGDAMAFDGGFGM